MAKWTVRFKANKIGNKIDYRSGVAKTRTFTYFYIRCMTCDPGSCFHMEILDITNQYGRIVQYAYTPGGHSGAIRSWFSIDDSIHENDFKSVMV